MWHTSWLFWALLFLSSTVASAQVVIPAAVRDAATAIQARHLKSDVEYLASDALRGRATPSPGLDSALAFVSRRLQELGLRPAGDDRTFLQRYRVRRLTLDTVNTYVEVEGRRIAFGPDLMVRFFGDSTPVTAPLVYVGHGIRMPRKNVDPFAGVDVRGRIVIAHGLVALPAGETFVSLGMANSDWFRVWDTARERAAIGLIIIPVAGALRNWDIARRMPWWRTAQDITPIAPNGYAPLTFPTVMVRWQRVPELFAGENIDLIDLMARAEAGDPLPSFQLRKRATLHIGIANTEYFNPSNVVAMVEGSDPQLRREAVVLMSHLDGAIGDQASVSADNIYNTADDNASGSAGLLGVAAALMRGPRPRRSVVLLWDTGEETGLWGSRHYAANPVIPLSNVVAYYNVDMIGRSRQPGPRVRGEDELTGPDEIYVTGPRVLSGDADSLFVQANRALHNLTLNRNYDVATHELLSAQRWRAAARARLARHQDSGRRPSGLPHARR